MAARATRARKSTARTNRASAVPASTVSSTTTTSRRHRARREDVEVWLDGHGVQWTFLPDQPIEMFDREKSLRNQARITQILNEERLETYTDAMTRGDRFPAVVAYEVSGKYVMIDGNHRLQAAINANKPLSVYLVDGKTDPAAIIVMTYEANAKHGLPNSVEDRQMHAIYLIRAGATSQENAAAALNLSKSQVQRAWLRSQADERANKVGLLERQWVGLPVAARTRLGAIRTDEGFAAAADLAISAGLTTEEIGRHVADINRERSAAGQRRIVNDLTPIYRSRIQARAGGTINPTKSTAASHKQRYLMGIGQVGRLTDAADVIVADVMDAELADLLERSEVALSVVKEVVDGLKKKQKSS